MRKTLLLASLITTISMASTGFVESNFKGDLNFTKADDMTVLTGNLDELSLKGEVKVDRFTLGAVLKNKDIKEISKVKPLTTEMYTENLLDNSSVYAKYELPEFAGIKSYVKGTLNPKAKYEADGTLNFKKGNVELEGQLAHSFSNGAEVSLTSKTTFPFEKKDGKYGKAASSEHTLKLEAKKLNNFEDLEASLTIGHVYAKDVFRKAELNAKGTYVGLKDTKLNGEFNFIDEKEDDGKTDKNMAVSLKAGANYKGVKDLELDGKFNFKYQVKGTSKVKDIITDSDILLNKDAYAHSYELDAKYTGVKDLELTAGTFVQHIHFDEGGLGNYVANPLELLYAQSIMSDDKDFIANKLNSLANAKKEYENAKKALNNLDADKKTEYDKAKDKYENAFKLVTEKLEKDLKDAQDAYNKLSTEEKKKADIAMQKTYKLTELDNETNKLNAEYQLLKNNNSPEANNAYLETRKKEIEDRLAVIHAETRKLNKDLLDNGNDTGEKLAVALYNKNNLNKETFNSSTEYTFDSNVTKLDSNGPNTPQSLYEGYTKSAYGTLAEALNKAKNNLDLEKEYKEKVEATKMFTAKLDLVNFGFKLGAKYTGVKNLTLTADGVFGGRHHSGFDQLLKYPSYTTGYVKLHAGAKYDYKLLSDKLVVSPEGNVTATFADIYAGLCNPSLVLAPKVSVSYKPVDALKVSGSVEVPVKFELNDFREFVYKNTSIKGSLNMRYEWK